MIDIVNEYLRYQSQGLINHEQWFGLIVLESKESISIKIYNNVRIVGGMFILKDSHKQNLGDREIRKFCVRTLEDNGLLSENKKVGLYWDEPRKGEPPKPNKAQQDVIDAIEARIKCLIPQIIEARELVRSQENGKSFTLNKKKY